MARLYKLSEYYLLDCLDEAVCHDNFIRREFDLKVLVARYGLAGKFLAIFRDIQYLSQLVIDHQPRFMIDWASSFKSKLTSIKSALIGADRK